MNQFLSISETFSKFGPFREEMKLHMQRLTNFQTNLNNITGEKFSITNIKEIGFLLKYFYELYENKDYNESFMYSFGFHGYMDNLEGISKNIKSNKLEFATFSKKGKKNGFKKAYYAPLIQKKHVKNDISLDKNITITGPNASGKTTILKTTLINIILSQQMGCGCYKSAILTCYKHIHCYLNIPDTSGRDSLFQAEARRCKEIIDAIHNNKKETHFCIFDELYSGTNPEEAVMSALGFMEYLVKFTNVKCLLTTHFIKVCKMLDKKKMIKNYHMETLKNNEKLNYTYLLKKGISEVRGGMKVLEDLSYPEEIIKTGRGFVNNHA